MCKSPHNGIAASVSSHLVHPCSHPTMLPCFGHALGASDSGLTLLLDSPRHGSPHLASPCLRSLHRGSLNLRSARPSRTLDRYSSDRHTLGRCASDRHTSAGGVWIPGVWI